MAFLRSYVVSHSCSRFVCMRFCVSQVLSDLQARAEEERQAKIQAKLARSAAASAGSVPVPDTEDAKKVLCVCYVAFGGGGVFVLFGLEAVRMEAPLVLKPSKRVCSNDVSRCGEAVGLDMSQHHLGNDACSRRTRRPDIWGHILLRAAVAVLQILCFWYESLPSVCPFPCRFVRRCCSCQEHTHIILHPLCLQQFLHVHTNAYLFIGHSCSCIAFSLIIDQVLEAAL